METHRTLPRLTHVAGRATQGARALPEEVAVALTYNGSTRAVMMATPADLGDFAYGFSLTEGIARPEEIESVEAVETPLGIDLQIWLSPGAAGREEKRRRSMAGPVGCGLCGIDSLEEALRTPAQVADAGLRLSPAEVMSAVAELPRHQPLHDQTHAAHAAAFWTPGAGIVLAREDVGRHNALDKLIGALRGQDVSGGALVLTCRASIDMMQKAAAAGFPLVIAASAPTAAAVRTAEAAGITLIGLARPDRFDVFTFPHRIAPEGSAHVA